MESVTLQMNQRGVITLPKSLRKAYNLRAGEMFTLLDLGGVFVLAPRASEVDRIADQIMAQWAADGQTLETMLQALHEERERRAH